MVGCFTRLFNGISSPFGKGERKSSLKRYNVCVIGDGACGKTSSIEVFVHRFFPQNYAPSVHEHYIHEVYLDNGGAKYDHIELGIVDTAGQESADHYRPLQMERAKVFLLCYDVTNRDSFENIWYKWLPHLVNNIYEHKILLCALKCDLRSADRDALDTSFVSHAEGLEMAKRIGAVRFMECSALRNQGVEEVFHEAARVAMGLGPEKMDLSSNEEKRNKGASGKRRSQDKHREKRSQDTGHDTQLGGD